MRVVLDTNTVISGLLWPGNPRRILDLARSGEVTLCSSQALLIELLDVLRRPKFCGSTGPDWRYPRRSSRWVRCALAEIIQVTTVEPLVAADPDDDEVLACALSAQANYVVSGDQHLLDLDRLGQIRIVNAVQFIKLRLES
ncbi:MAG: putative toxin-antitoxin system toxin component, PIN family [Anaerolineales bacterium]|nr:putative toxin-antitoxin system toxin component, PIN family [Anaerolineales bacterium]